MIYLKKIESFFPVFLILAVFSGFFIPDFFMSVDQNIPIHFFLMGIMTLLFLKIDLIDILTHIKKPLLITYITFIHLIVLPILAYWLFQFLDPSLRISIVLLAALPAGVSSAVFTDIMKGRTSLSLLIVIISNLLSILTIPLIFYLISHLGEAAHLAGITDGSIKYLDMLNKLSFVIFIPLLIAKIIKKVILRRYIDKLNLPNYYNVAILVLLYFMISIAIAFQAEVIKYSWQSLFIDIVYLFMSFFVFQFVGYFSLVWLRKGDKIAAANSTMIMNNVLGIVLALVFFGDNPEIVMYITLSFIPWNLMIIFKHWYIKYLP